MNPYMIFIKSIVFTLYYAISLNLSIILCALIIIDATDQMLILFYKTKSLDYII